MRDYWLRFGSGNPADNSGLSPTFTTFIAGDGSTIAPPGITEPVSGTGLYLFQYHPTQTIAFTVDGATLGLTDSDRYIVGSIDPFDLLNDQVGSTASVFGDNLTDPTTVFGFLKRCQEFLEGNSTYTKASGELTYSSRGASETLAVKTISDDSTSTTKT